LYALARVMLQFSVGGFTMRRLMCSALFAIGVASGCAGSTTGGVYATASYTTPDLVYVSPGVQVIADYDEPIFYSDGFYWRYYGDTWYRSPTYTGGWIYARPPAAVLRIDRPYAYRRYRPSGYVTRRDRHYDQRPVYRDNRDYRQPAPVVRDHRDPRYQPRPAPPPAPVYRGEQRSAPPRAQPQPQPRTAPVYRGDQRYVPPRATPQPRPEARPRTDDDRARDERERRDRDRDHR